MLYKCHNFTCYYFTIQYNQPFKAKMYMDKENRLVVTRGEGVWVVGIRGKGAHIYGEWQIIMYNWNFTVL